MSLAEFTNISEIVSSIAIIITLIFLSIQMRHNTRALYATMRQSVLDEDSRLLSQVVTHPDMMIRNAKPDLTDEEVVSHYATLTLFIRHRENDFVQYKNGVLDKQTWERFKNSISGTFMFERNQNFWFNYAQTSFEPGFVKEMNAIIRETRVINKSVPSYIRSLFEKA